MAKKPDTPPAKPDTAAATARLQSWIEVFRAGTHRDSEGRECTFTADDLDQMVRNESLGAAPAVLGHPKHDDPAWAWSNGFRRDGDTLLCRFTDINPAFAAGVASKAYRNRSISVVKDPASGWRVRHVGWLGAMPPAIDGLKAAFSAEASGEVHEFGALDSAGNALTQAAANFQSIRDQLIESAGIDAADRALPQWRIDYMRELADQVADEPDDVSADDIATAFAAAAPNKDHTMTIDQAAIDRAVQEALDKQQKTFSAQITAANDRAEQALAGQRTQRITGQITEWRRAGKVLPAEERGLAEFMASIEDGQPAGFTFSAADGKEAKQTPAEWFASFMASRAPVVKLGQNGRGDFGGDDPEPPSVDPAELAGKARTYMAEQERAGISITYAAAVSHVSRQK